MSTIDNPESQDILARLKSETTEIHRQTENLMPFTKEDFTLSDYKHLLAAFYKFYESFEPPLERTLKLHSINFDYHQRLKTPLLEADRRNLNLYFSSEPKHAATNEATLFDSKEKIFGALYVIEGSTLGGQVISRILKRKFDLDQTNGAAFFNGYGSATGAMWNDFRAAITAFAATSDNFDEIVAAAHETFRRIGRTVGDR